VTRSAAIRETGANRDIGIQVADSIAFVWSLSLCLRELPLEQLPPSANRAEGIAIDDVER
jgi:hypothetical protein